MEERDALEQQIQDLSDTVKNFEQQVIQAKENERLLIMYPDLHGPVNPDMNGKGRNVFDTMFQVLFSEQFVHSNNFTQQAQAILPSIWKIR